jgi:long-chain acyl-CoA synthetase
VVVGENRPRLYAAMLARTVAGRHSRCRSYQDAAAAELVFPIGNAEVGFAVVEDQEQVDKMIEVRATCPGLGRDLVRRPAGPAPVRRAWPRAARRPGRGRPGLGREASRLLRRRGRQGRAGRRRRAVLHLGTTGNPKGVVHTHETLIDRAAAGARFDKLTADDEVLAYLPPAWIGQNIFSYAQWLVCGYVVNCPESAGTVTDRPEGDRPDLLFRAAARLRRPAHQRDDPHGGRRPAQALAVRPRDGAGRAGSGRR